MVKFLKGSRFNSKAREQFVMMAEDYELIDYGSEKWIQQLKRFLSRHKTEQLERLKELKRYYEADNNIKYRPAKTDEYAADNRIASDFGRFITVFEQGYMLGKPVEYKNEDIEIQGKINEFSVENNEEYHNVLIKTDLSIYGRAYELVTVIKPDESELTTIRLNKLNPQQTFIIYDDTHERNSLLGVNYYTLDYGDGHRKAIVKLYTRDMVYTYEDDNKNSEKGMVLREDLTEEHFFDGVPINEFANNEDRLGAYESQLDNIDAYDLSQSELANFQQDSVDAILVISGNPYTGRGQNDYLEDGTLNPNGPLAVSLGYKRAKILILDDNPNKDGAKPDAFYLKKEYDAAGAESYKQRLVDDILRFTFTPDTNDKNFSGNQTGEAMKYKLMGSDNLRSQQERLFKKGLMRRLRLVANIWSIKGNAAIAYDKINETNIIFTPNIPKSEKEWIDYANSLHGILSNETVFELISKVTGVKSEDEIKRLKDEVGEVPLPRVSEVELDAEEDA